MLDATLPGCERIDSQKRLAEAAGKPARQAPRSTVVSCPGCPGSTQPNEELREAYFTHELTYDALAYQTEWFRPRFVNPLCQVCPPVCRLHTSAQFCQSLSTSRRNRSVRRSMASVRLAGDVGILLRLPVCLAILRTTGWVTASSKPLAAANGVRDRLLFPRTP
jgi:hypothetical protein